MSIRSLLDMFAVLGCKAGGILVNLIFLPLYQRLLSPADFGIVALVISIQALLTLMDLGTSTLVARDMAASRATGDFKPATMTWRASELLFLTLFLAALLVVALAAGLGFSDHVAPGSRVVTASLALVLFLALVLNNIAFTALNALQSYRRASLVQVVGVLVRAVATVGALHFYRANILTFMLVQAITAGLHLVVARRMLVRDIRAAGADPGHTGRLADSLALLSRAKPLILMGVSGALATQLDKTIVSLNMSVAALGPYFLACTYALTPASVLGAPVSQYFLPRIVGHVVTGTENSGAARHTAKRFAMALSAITVLPSALLFLYCDQWVGVWLHHSVAAAPTAVLARVFVVAGAIASLGYVPFVLLNAVQDYKHVAIVSTLLMPPLLLSTWVFTAQQELMRVVWSYVVYYSLVMGLNCWQATRSTAAAMARTSLKLTAFYTVCLFAFELAIHQGVALSGISQPRQHWAATIITAVAGAAVFFVIRNRRLSSAGEASDPATVYTHSN